MSVIVRDVVVAFDAAVLAAPADGDSVGSERGRLPVGIGGVGVVAVVAGGDVEVRVSTERRHGDGEVIVGRVHPHAEVRVLEGGDGAATGDAVRETLERLARRGAHGELGLHGVGENTCNKWRATHINNKKQCANEHRFGASDQVLGQRACGVRRAGWGAGGKRRKQAAVWVCCSDQ